MKPLVDTPAEPDDAQPDDAAAVDGAGRADRAAAVAAGVRERVQRLGDAIGEFETEALDESDSNRESIQYERSARAVLRLIVCAVAIAVVVALAELLPLTHAAIEADLGQTAGRWKVGLGDLGDAVAAAASLLTILLSLTAAVLARRPRQVVTSVVAAAAGAAVVIVAARVGGSTPGRVLAEEWSLAAVAAAVAVTSASFAVFAAPIARWAARSIAFFTLLGVLGATTSLEVRTLALLVGGAVGAATALVFGTPTRFVTRSELAAALELVRMPVSTLEPHGGDARGSQPWLATLTTDRKVFVKVAAVDELRSDQLFRMWRRLRMRRADDERSAASTRRAVEHEAFVAQRAAAAGVNTPGVVGLGTLADDRGMFVVFATVSGCTLDECDEPSDALLRSAWSQIQVLRRSRIAHRDLRAANLMAVGDEAWVIDFGFAEIAASDDLLDRDMAELLASTASQVGVERAVSNAVAVLGADELAGAIPWIQPLAMSRATGGALSKGQFEELRERVRSAAGISAPDVPELRRVSRKGVVSVLALGVAIWAVLPQVTKGIDWSTVLEAHLGWAAIAVVASVATYIGAAVCVVGCVPDDLPVGTTFLAQIASSFTNRVTPAKVGGMALNVRYLVKQGVDTASATTGIAVSTAAGSVVHIALTVVALLWAGNVGLPGISLPSASVFVWVAAAIVVVVVAVGVVPPARRWVTGTVVPALRRSLRSFLLVMTSPRNVMMLFGGSTIVTVSNLVAFAVSLRAFDIDIPVSTVAVVFLAGSALASAAPTPGGLGAAEAALVAGLAVVSVSEQSAIPAVLLFRLATFWLPIFPGWVALTVLQRRGNL